MEKFCQSCGMPMKKDPQLGGTNSDGSKSEKFCSYCYVEGQFMQPDMNAKEMQSFCIEKMKEQGIPRFVGWLFTRSIPRLERWKHAS
jgi:hypothetical protein